jgi:hypothetical protein
MRGPMSYEASSSTGGYVEIVCDGMIHGVVVKQLSEVGRFGRQTSVAEIETRCLP